MPTKETYFACYYQIPKVNLLDAEINKQIIKNGNEYSFTNDNDNIIYPINLKNNCLDAIHKKTIFQVIDRNNGGEYLIEVYRQFDVSYSLESWDQCSKVFKNRIFDEIKEFPHNDFFNKIKLLSDKYCGSALIDSQEEINGKKDKRYENFKNPYFCCYYKISINDFQEVLPQLKPLENHKIFGFKDTEEIKYEVRPDHDNTDAVLMKTYIQIVDEDSDKEEYIIEACRNFRLYSPLKKWNLCKKTIRNNFFDENKRKEFPHNDFFKNATLLSEKYCGHSFVDSPEDIQNQKEERYEEYRKQNPFFCCYYKISINDFQKVSPQLKPLENDKIFGFTKEIKYEVKPDLDNTDAVLMETYIQIVDEDSDKEEYIIEACRNFRLYSPLKKWNLCKKTIRNNFFDENKRKEFPHNDFFEKATLLSDNSYGWTFVDSFEDILGKKDERYEALKNGKTFFVVYFYLSDDEYQKSCLKDLEKDQLKTFTDNEKKDFRIKAPKGTFYDAFYKNTYYYITQKNDSYCVNICWEFILNTPKSKWEVSKESIKYRFINDKEKRGQFPYFSKIESYINPETIDCVFFENTDKIEETNDTRFEKIQPKEYTKNILFCCHYKILKNILDYFYLNNQIWEEKDEDLLYDDTSLDSYKSESNCNDDSINHKKIEENYVYKIKKYRFSALPNEEEYQKEQGSNQNIYAKCQDTFFYTVGETNQHYYIEVCRIYKMLSSDKDWEKCKDSIANSFFNSDTQKNLPYNKFFEKAEVLSINDKNFLFFEENQNQDQKNRFNNALIGKVVYQRSYKICDDRLEEDKENYKIRIDTEIKNLKKEQDDKTQKIKQEKIEEIEKIRKKQANEIDELKEKQREEIENQNNEKTDITEKLKERQAKEINELKEKQRKEIEKQKNELKNLITPTFKYNYINELGEQFPVTFECIKIEYDIPKKEEEKKEEEKKDDIITVDLNVRCTYNVLSSPIFKEKVKKEYCEKPSSIEIHKKLPPIDTLFPEFNLLSQLNNEIHMYYGFINNDNTSDTLIKDKGKPDITISVTENPFFYNTIFCRYESSPTSSSGKSDQDNKKDFLHIFEEKPKEREEVSYKDAIDILLKKRHLSRIYFVESKELKDILLNEKYKELFNEHSFYIEEKPSKECDRPNYIRGRLPNNQNCTLSYIDTRIIWKDKWHYIVICNDYYLDNKEIEYEGTIKYLTENNDKEDVVEKLKALISSYKTKHGEKEEDQISDISDSYDYFFNKVDDINILKRENFNEDNSLFLFIGANPDFRTVKINSNNTVVNFGTNLTHVTSLVDDKEIFDQFIDAAGVLEFCKKTSTSIEIKDKDSLKDKLIDLLPKEDTNEKNDSPSYIDTLLRMKRKLKSIERNISTRSSGTNPEKKVYSYFLKKNYCEEFISDSIDQIDSKIETEAEENRLEEKERLADIRKKEEELREEENRRTTTVLSLLSIFAIPPAYISIHDMLKKIYTLLNGYRGWRLTSFFFSLVILFSVFGLSVLGLYGLLNALGIISNKRKNEKQIIDIDISKTENDQNKNNIEKSEIDNQSKGDYTNKVKNSITIADKDEEKENKKNKWKFVKLAMLGGNIGLLLFVFLCFILHINKVSWPVFMNPLFYDQPIALIILITLFLITIVLTIFLFVGQNCSFIRRKKER